MVLLHVRCNTVTWCCYMYVVIQIHGVVTCSSFRHCFTVANLPSKLKIKQQNGQSKNIWHKRTIIFTSSTPTTHHPPLSPASKGKTRLILQSLVPTRGVRITAYFMDPYRTMWVTQLRGVRITAYFLDPYKTLSVSDAAKRCPNNGLSRGPVQNINFVRVSLRFRVQHSPMVLMPCCG